MTNFFISFIKSVFLLVDYRNVAVLLATENSSLQDEVAKLLQGIKERFPQHLFGSCSRKQNRISLGLGNQAMSWEWPMVIFISVFDFWAKNSAQGKFYQSLCSSRAISELSVIEIEVKPECLDFSHLMNSLNFNFDAAMRQNNVQQN